MAENAAENAMAAAVAAAAELAKNGGMSLFHHVVPHHGTASASGKDGSLSNRTGSPTENCEKGNDSGSASSKMTVLSHSHTEDDSLEIEEDAEKRLARSRERNREHARRTRLRKKAQLEALQSKVKGLEAESRLLKQSIEECSIASILVGLSSKNQQSVTDTLLDATQVLPQTRQKVSLMVGGKRKRFVSEEAVERPPQPLKLNIDGQITLIGGGKTHINWKSGVYCDENGVQRQLTQEQLECLRRERNRMHAKMTRDRKKCFIAAIEKTIEELENDNKRMREALTKVAKHHFGSSTGSPVSSPLATPPPPAVSPHPPMELGNSVLSTPTTHPKPQDQPIHAPEPRRVPHGFTLSVP